MTTRPLYDNHGRPITYARIAVTDRCNLRCFYCMPEEGIHYLPKKQLLTFEEIERLTTILAELGITKVRLTGGEPFVRTDLMKLIRSLVKIEGIHDVHLTTNGILTEPHIDELKALGIASVNLSLDTLDRQRFKTITRRDEFEATHRTLQKLIASNIKVKINAVVMEGKNIEDIIAMAQMTEHENISVRFIEEMPFNGEGSHYPKLNWTHQRIVAHLREHFPALQKIQDEPHATAYHYQVPGFKGDIGVIAAFSRTFCGTCNRIRITAQGILKTCLYDDGVLNVRDLMRAGASDDEIKQKLTQAFSLRHKDGWEAEKNRKSNLPVTESMSTIGG